MIGILPVVAATMLLAGPAPASPKPCRDAQGRVAPCSATGKERHVRRKNDKGRFGILRQAERTFGREGMTNVGCSGRRHNLSQESERL